MPFRGKQNGIEIYDHVSDLTDQQLESGQDYYILYPPAELDHKGGSMVLQHDSPADPITWSVVALMVAKIILVVAIGTIIILTLQQIAVIIRGREGKKIDKNLFEGGDGSVWSRDPNTGEWTMITPPRNNLILYAVIGIFLIGIIIAIYLNRQKLFGSSEGAKSGSSGSTEKENEQEEA